MTSSIGGPGGFGPAKGPGEGDDKRPAKKVIYLSSKGKPGVDKSNGEDTKTAGKVSKAQSEVAGQAQSGPRTGGMVKHRISQFEGKSPMEHPTRGSATMSKKLPEVEGKGESAPKMSTGKVKQLAALFEPRGETEEVQTTEMEGAVGGSLSWRERVFGMWTDFCNRIRDIKERCRKVKPFDPGTSELVKIRAQRSWSRLTKRMVVMKELFLKLGDKIQKKLGKTPEPLDDETWMEMQNVVSGEFDDSVGEDIIRLQRDLEDAIDASNDMDG